MKAVVIPVKLY